MKYLDTSAYIKYYSDEESEAGAKQVQEVIDNADRESGVISSAMLIGESVSVLDKWRRMGILTEEEFKSVLSDLVLDFKDFVEEEKLHIEDVNIVRIKAAVDQIVEHGLPINDALHLHAALLNKDKMEEFYCSDKNLKEAAKEEGFNVIDPEKQSKKS